MQAHPIRCPRAPVHKPYTSDRQRYLSQLLCKEFLKPRISIYYRRDNMTSAFWKKHAPRLEPLLCSKSDLVATNSPQLAEAVKSYNSNCHDIGQGVDLESFRDGASYLLPEDMKKIKRPIIGYMGWITSRRLDADLMYEAAKRLPECSMVLVGGEDDYFKSHKLHSLGNVFFWVRNNKRK